MRNFLDRSEGEGFVDSIGMMERRGRTAQLSGSASRARTVAGRLCYERVANADNGRDAVDEALTTTVESRLVWRPRSWTVAIRLSLSSGVLS